MATKARKGKPAPKLVKATKPGAAKPSDKGKLAKDAKLDELPKVMDAIEEVDAKDEEAEDEEESEAEAEAEAK